MKARKVPVEEVATAYLRHEFRKLFIDLADHSFWPEIERSVMGLRERLGERDFWQLISGISEGLKLKWVYRILTDNSFTWHEEEVPISTVKLTGMGRGIDELIKKRAEGEPEKLIKLYKSDSSFRKALRQHFAALSLPRDPIRERDPILVREKDGRFPVFDGMRRVLFAILDGRKTIRAYVGRVTNPRGKMMVNTDKIYFLKLLFEKSKRQRVLRPHFVAIAKEIIAQSRNGKSVWRDRMRSWLKDPEFQGIAKEILEK